MMNEMVAEGEAFDPHDFTTYLRSLFLWLFSVNKHVTNMSDTREIQSWPEPKWN